MLKLLSAVLSFGLLIGCERKPTLAPADHSYAVRARIVEMPRENAFLQLHHAEIPEFKSRTNAVVGMKEMVMEFPGLTPEVEQELGRFAPGDGVEVSFEVRWNSDPRLLVTRMTKLPADADLGLKKSLQSK